MTDEFQVVKKGASLLASLLVGLLCSCGDKEKEPGSPETQEEPKPVEKPFVFSLLAEDRYDYRNGNLIEQTPPYGFRNKWKGGSGGKAEVRDGELVFNSPIRTSCVFDTTRAGPFLEFLDENEMIGRNGKTIYLSYYQTLVDVTEDQVAIVEFVQGDRDVHHFTQFNTGTDTTPSPPGPFGLRIKRNTDFVIAAPEEMNSRENLIVLKIQFGHENQDKLYYYYNPSPEDEKKPDGALEAGDLSFDRYGMGCFTGGKMNVRHFRIADNFKSVVIAKGE